MVNHTWIELPLTEQGKRQPIDHLVRELHEAGFMARRVRDFCTSASETEFYLEPPTTDSFVNNTIACRIDSLFTYNELLQFVKKHSDFFHQLPDDIKLKLKRDNPYLQYLLAGLYNSNVKAIHAARSVKNKNESKQELDAVWKDIDIDSTLRPYQVKAKEDILNAWSQSRHVMMQMPTGTGKTRLFVSIIADIRRHTPDAKVLIVTHRKELVEQISHSLAWHYHLPHGILSGSSSKNEQADILVSSIQTLARRIYKWSDLSDFEAWLDKLLLDKKKQKPIVEKDRLRLVSAINDLKKSYRLSSLEIAIDKIMDCRDVASQYELLKNIKAEIHTLTEHRVQSTGAGHAKADYIIVDEAHHVLAPSYRQLWQVYPEARILGVTATPYRLRRSSFTELFDTLVESLPICDFINEGYLAKYRYYTVSNRVAMIQYINRLSKFNMDGDYLLKDLDECCNKDEVISFLVDCYETYAAEKKGIVYAVNQSHGERIAEQFRKRGVTALSIDCKTPAKERAQALADFREDKLRVLVNVELFTEGFDCPSIEFVLLARPTRSLGLYLQQVGRALRPSPTDESVIILDAAGLYGRFGLPDRKRDWAVHFKGEKSKKENYNRPLGYAGGTPSYQLMIDVSHKQVIESNNIEKTPHEWSIYHIVKKQNLLNKDGNTILKRHLLVDLKQADDGNYSAWLGTRKSDCKEKSFIRFTPDLALIPDHAFDLNGCRFYAFLPHEMADSSAVNFFDTLDKREYTLSLDLESLRYTNVYSWNTDWVVMKRNSLIFHYTNRDFYPGVKECKVSFINDEPFFFTQDFIVGKYSNKHFYHRLPHGLYLYYRREGKKDVLYNAQLEPIWRGKKIEVLNDGMILYALDGQSRKVLYMDIIFGHIELAGKEIGNQVSNPVQSINQNSIGA